MVEVRDRNAVTSGVADERGRRLDAATGVVFAVLTVVAVALPGTPPKADASSETLVKFFGGHRGDVLAGDFLLGLAAFFFLWFLGSVRSYLRAGEGGAGRVSSAAFAGGAVGIALLLAGAGVLNGTAFKVASSGDTNLIRALFDLSNGLFTLSAFGFAVFFAAASCSAARSGALPPWAFWSGSVVSALQVVSGIALFARSGFFAIGNAFGFIALLAGLLWVATVSVVMTRRDGIPPVARTTP